MLSEIKLVSLIKGEMELNSLSNGQLNGATVAFVGILEQMPILCFVRTHILETCWVKLHCPKRIRYCCNLERVISLHRFDSRQLLNFILLITEMFN